ncbi:MBL fold metallo-hydrolase [Fructilactobacillus sp. Tb1]|uniref:MBL fold metallo-hydrolase n=1 Tax=Fructilactobacillus sp. Tb1 TaxID=3422304 RepID=UPI003D283222
MNNDDFKVCVLSSGSGGNVTYIETPEHKIIEDAGLSGIRIQRLMQSIGKDLKDVDSLFVTHEHSDHSKAVGILARKYGMDVYANQATWDAMNRRIGKIKPAQRHIFAPDTIEELGDLEVESFSVSHDAAHAQFYDYRSHGKSFAIVTDTGALSKHAEEVMRGADGYLFECNYDTDMLLNGDYHYATKMRIQSDEGHLSNVEGAELLMDIMGPNTKEIFLGHRSHHNNTKELQIETVSRLMKSNGLAVGKNFKIHGTDVEKPSKLYTL